MINVLNRKISSGWAYAAILVTAFAFLTPAVTRTIGKFWRGDIVVGKAIMTPEQTLVEFEEVKRIVESEPTRVEDYPLMLTRLRRLQYPVQWYVTNGRPYKDSWAHKLTQIAGAAGLQGTLFNKYHERFGQEEWSIATRAYFDAHPEDESPRDTNSIRYRGTISVGVLWVTCYLWTLPFLGLFFAVRLHEAGFKVWLEFFAPLRPALATVFWPVGVFVYPNGDAARQLVQVGRFLAMVLTTTMSVFAGGVAKAAEKTDGSQKKQQGWSLQIDGHHYERVGGSDPDPDELLRVNLGTPSGFYIEALRLRNQSEAVSFLTAGTPIARSGNGVVNAYVGVKAVREEPAGSKSVLAGIQAFMSKKRFSFALPVAQVERTMALKPTTTVAALGVATAGFGKRCYAGAELLVKRTSNGSGFWYAGPVLGWNINPALMAKLGCFRNSDEEVRCRVRAMHTIRW